ncbi:MAG TPA: hypothetical protein GX507_04480 [Clostridia bacterium]|nr:hypothetical protein [Clostridia bacterium]
MKRDENLIIRDYSVYNPRLVKAGLRLWVQAVVRVLSENSGPDGFPDGFSYNNKTLAVFSEPNPACNAQSADCSPNSN